MQEDQEQDAPAIEAEYSTLLELEDLESLLEELEERGISGFEPEVAVQPELRARMGALGVHDVQQIRDRIMHLHATLDEDERDLTITDS